MGQGDQEKARLTMRRFPLPKKARGAIQTQAVKEIENWVEAVIGDYLTGDDLQVRRVAA